jgi:aspartate/methionine/tyrosine aminotransferase
MYMGQLGEAHQAKTGELFGLHVGQPSSGAPLLAREAAAQAVLHPGPLGYTTALGNPALRKRISQWYAEANNVEVDPARILITAGASGAFVVAFLACFEPGARVGVTEPGYPCYRNDLSAFGVTPIPIPVGPETRWAPTPDLLDSIGPLDGLIIASPANPTGTIIEPTLLASLVTWCDTNNVQLISDEIYHGITYRDTVTASVLEFSDRPLVINSFSKYFGMTGWRLGWLVAPPQLTETVERLHGNLAICAPNVSQVAGLAAFDATDELQQNVAAFAAKRTIMVDGMRSAGLHNFAPPDGAFYLYTDVSQFGIDSMTLCRRWLDECSVLATPGLDFDPVRGHGTVRFSFAGSQATIDEACRRLADWTHLELRRKPGQH